MFNIHLRKLNGYKFASPYTYIYIIFSYNYYKRKSKMKQENVTRSGYDEESWGKEEEMERRSNSDT